MKYTIDAANKVVGRVASEAASVLLGKNSVAFKKNTVAGTVVEIINAGKVKLSEKKLANKEYVSFSGYPGGQKRLTQQMILDKKGESEIIRRAVYKMLPKNRLQDVRIKNLKIVQ